MPLFPLRAFPFIRNLKELMSAPNKNELLLFHCSIEHFITEEVTVPFCLKQY